MNFRPRHREQPRIDLTPLIDVVFLLLIFFMVSTTFDKHTRLSVELPEASTRATTEPDDRQLALSIDAEGRYYLQGDVLLTQTPAGLERSLKQAMAMRPDMAPGDIPVLVTGDRSAPLQSALTVLDIAGRLGLVQIRFVARLESGDDSAAP